MPYEILYYELISDKEELYSSTKSDFAVIFANDRNASIYVDKYALNEKISLVQNTQKGNYTDETWTAFQNALAVAQTVAVNANATQVEVDNALAALNAAYTGLMEKGSFTLVPAAISIYYKSTTRITANGGQPITWTSSDPSVATVEANGTVTAIGRSGTAVITATTTEGQSATCRVTVSMSIWQWIVYILFFGWLWGF